MDTRCVLAAAVAAGVFFSTAAFAEQCSGNPDALGTSRTIAVDPTEHARIGSMQYAKTLPLAHKEVVLTFDDGPLPPYTGRILQTLKAECVKATFFMVGRMARAYPEWVRRAYNAGHTVATHSHSHPRYFGTLEHQKAIGEIEDGIAAMEAALGDKRALSPFFRFPGLGRTAEAERHLAERGIMAWSADAHGDDWMGITAATVIDRLLTRLERKGRGVLLLHDIQPVTVVALPDLLGELKRRGYRLVHVVPAGPDRPKTVTEPAAWVLQQERAPVKPARSTQHAQVQHVQPLWPKVLAAEGAATEPELPLPSTLSFGFPEPFAAEITVAPFDGAGDSMAIRGDNLAGLTSSATSSLPTVWPPVSEQIPALSMTAALPVPSIASLDLSGPAGRLREIPAAQAELRASPGHVARSAAATERHARAARLRAAQARAEAAPERNPEPTWFARQLNWFH